MRTTYRFRNDWILPASRHEIFDVLADVEGYPAWWPQVRGVTPIDDDSVHVVARSMLPYSLALVLERAVEDRAIGVLEARIHGHLDGWSRWTLHDAGTTTAVRYEQAVEVRGRLLQVASAVGRPVLVANHAWMMRGGRRGLLSRCEEQGRGTAR